MAYGGWIHYSGVLQPAGDPYYSDAALAEVLDGVMAALTADPDWSVKKAATKHYSNYRGYHGICQHTSSAEMAFVWVTYTTNSSWINAINGREGYTGNGGHDSSLMIAYHPAGTGTFDAAKTPLDVDWSSNPALMSKLYRVVPGGALPQSNSPDKVTFLVRGADAIFCYAANWDLDIKTDYCAMYGNLLESPLVHDPNDTELYCAVLMGANVTSTVTPEFDFFNAAGDTMLLGERLDLWDYLNPDYVASPPFNKIQYQLYAPLAGGAVYGTDGMKGLVSDEVTFLTASNAAYPHWTWLGDGVNPTHMHIGNGVWVGWDSSNGQWD